MTATPSAGKKLINNVEFCVDDNIAGLVAINPGLRKLKGHRVVLRSDIKEYIKAGKVAVICGGGSGHEPVHAGYVGVGMLSAAIPGSVFTAPPPADTFAAIKAVGVNNTAGVLVMVHNYTGDRLTFAQAVEKARSMGIKVDMIVVGEDCALTSTDRTAGRRGLAGNLLNLKIAGAMAEQGASLEEIASTVRHAAERMGTIGLSLSPCSVPGSGPSFHLEADEMELGLGVHGEAGVKRIKLLPAKEAVSVMLDHMTSASNATALDLKAGDRVACLINNLGGTSVLEMNIIANETINYLENRGVMVVRAYCGPLMTSLEMAGLSISLLHVDEKLCSYLDAETTAPGWCHPYLPSGCKDRFTPAEMEFEDDQPQSGDKDAERQGVCVSSALTTVIYKCVMNACDSLIDAKGELNTLDQQSGDGDCGLTMARGAAGILEHMRAESSSPVQVRPAELCVKIASYAENSMGGSSGGLYSLFFTAAARALQAEVTPESWCDALQFGIHAVKKYGGAEEGDRTMLDALCPALSALKQGLKSVSPMEAFEQAVKACESGTAATADMEAHAGRASYVSAQKLTLPDPGAKAVSIWMRAILDTLKAV